MANALYGLGRQAYLEGGIAWLTDNIKVCLIHVASYTVAINTDQFLAIIPGGAIIATSPNLGGKTSPLGVANGATLVFGAVAGLSIEAFVMYKDTGVAATSPLIAYIDTVASGFPYTPTGIPVAIVWDTGANKIFKL